MPFTEVDPRTGRIPPNSNRFVHPLESNPVDIAGYQRSTFFRQPNWRYLRALEIMGATSDEKQIDDETTQNLVTVLADPSGDTFNLMVNGT